MTGGVDAVATHSPQQVVASGQVGGHAKLIVQRDVDHPFAAANALPQRSGGRRFVARRFKLVLKDLGRQVVDAAGPRARHGDGHHLPSRPSGLRALRDERGSQVEHGAVRGHRSCLKAVLEGARAGAVAQRLGGR